MEHSKQKVFVFDKAELFFLFLFFIVMAITSFVLGMRLGKKQAELFLHPEAQIAQPALELKSKHEEVIDDSEPKANQAGEATSEEQAFVDKAAASSTTADMDEQTFKKLQEEYQKLNASELGSLGTEATPANGVANTSDPQGAVQSVTEKTADNSITKNSQPSISALAPSDGTFLTPDPSFIGQYTIQLGSYRTIEEAKNFAEGFLVRGYKPLVREVEVRSQGTWYRVSLGVFESISAATQYIQKEGTLFGSFKKDQYFIQEIK